MAVKIKDISEQLGLSVSTVSKALNGYSDISEKTRALVLEASEELGYHPNTVARNLRRQRTDKIGIVYPLKGLESEVLLGFFRGLALAAQTHGYNLLLYTAPAGDADALRKICRSKEVDGMVLMGTSVAGILRASVALLQREATPFVVLGHPVEEGGVPFVASDNEAGVSSLMRHLLELGHTRIAYIARSDDVENNAARFKTYKKTLQEVGLFNPDYVAEAPYTPYSGSSAMRSLLEHPHPPSAVLAFNDHIALDACRAATEHGLSIPQDIAVAGYGNIPSSLMVTPALTTVALPLKEMGGAALEILLSLIEKKETTPSSRVFATELMIRASTQPPHLAASH